MRRTSDRHINRSQTWLTSILHTITIEIVKHDVTKRRGSSNTEIDRVDVIARHNNNRTNHETTSGRSRTSNQVTRIDRHRVSAGGDTTEVVGAVGASGDRWATRDRYINTNQARLTGILHTITIQVIPHPITDSRRRIETEIGAILIITRADRKRLTRPTKGVHHTSRQIRERQCNRVSARGKAREVVSAIDTRRLRRQHCGPAR